MSRRSKHGERVRAQVLEAVVELTRENGIPPSVREIRDAAGLSSVSGVVYHLRVLEADGVIARHAGKARGIVLLEGGVE